MIHRTMSERSYHGATSRSSKQQQLQQQQTCHNYIVYISGISFRWPCGISFRRPSSDTHYENTKRKGITVFPIINISAYLKQIIQDT